MVLSVFGVTDRSVRPHMTRPIYHYHPVRMTDGGFRTLIPCGPHDGKKIDFCPTPRGQLGFPKTHGELREIKEFADGQVRHDQWKKRWLWTGHVLERHKFTPSDETRDERDGVGVDRTVKRLERERETTPEGTQKGESIPLLLSTDKVFVLHPRWVCVFPVFPTHK